MYAAFALIAGKGRSVPCPCLVSFHEGKVTVHILDTLLDHALGRLLRQPFGKVIRVPRSIQDVVDRLVPRGRRDNSLLPQVSTEFLYDLFFVLRPFPLFLPGCRKELALPEPDGIGKVVGQGRDLMAPAIQRMSFPDMYFLYSISLHQLSPLITLIYTSFCVMMIT